MVEEVVLASYGYYPGGGIGEMLAMWEQYGFFSYLLPFLLIFALVFGILSRMKLFGENNAISGIIALAVGLMALQFEFVSVFFAEIFPRMGVGLAIFLVVLILAGLFIDPHKAIFRWVLVGIGLIIAIVVLSKTAGAVNWYSGYWWQENWPLVAGAIVIIALIGTIIGSASGKTQSAWNWWPMPNVSNQPTS